MSDSDKNPADNNENDKEQEDLERLFADFDPEMVKEFDKQGDDKTSDGPKNPFGAGSGGFDPFQFLSGGFGPAGSMFGQAQDPWAMARSIAGSVASANESEPNIDPAERIEYENIARVAEITISTQTSLNLLASGAVPAIRPATRHEWALATLDAYRPLLEKMSDSMGNVLSESLSQNSPELEGIAELGLPTDFFANFAQYLAPIMFSTTSGTVAGQLAQRQFGSYDLPISRSGAKELLVVSRNINDFAKEWRVEPVDMWLWVCFHEYLNHAVLSVEHVEAKLNSLITSYVTAFRARPDALESGLEGVDTSNPAALASIMNDPDTLIGMVRSDEQKQILPQISALLSVIVGYVDYMMDHLCGPLLKEHTMMAEAIRRHRVGAAPSDRFVEKMLGFNLDRDCYDLGRDFIDGVVERAGTEALAGLWESAEALPTPNELAAPGLWLARTTLEN